MVEPGYDDDFATALTITSSVEGILVPPSHHMVIYATSAGGVSVGALFMAGYLSLIHICKVSRAFLRYLGVFLLVMLLSAVLTSSLHLWLGWSVNTAKIPVDIVLCFVCLLYTSPRSANSRCASASASPPRS